MADAAEDGNTIQFAFTPQFVDYDALCNAMTTPKIAKWRNIAVWALVFINAGIGVFVLMTSDFDRPQEYVPWNFLVAALILFLRFPVTRWFRQWNFRRLEINKWDALFSISDNKIENRNAIMNASVDWSAIKKATITKTHAFLWLNPIQAFIIPLRALKADENRGQMLAMIRRKVSKIET